MKSNGAGVPSVTERLTVKSLPASLTESIVFICLVRNANKLGGLYLRNCKKLFKESICKIKTKHSFCIEKWHFTHGSNGFDPRYIEGFEVCSYCGKRRYFRVKRGSRLEQYIIEYMKDRQW